MYIRPLNHLDAPSFHNYSLPPNLYYSNCQSDVYCVENEREELLTFSYNIKPTSVGPRPNNEQTVNQQLHKNIKLEYDDVKEEVSKKHEKDL